MLMPVFDLVRLGTAGTLTNQMLVDMALQADREARRFVTQGDLKAAANARRESIALCELLK